MDGSSSSRETLPSHTHMVVRPPHPDVLDGAVLVSQLTHHNTEMLRRQRTRYEELVSLSLGPAAAAAPAIADVVMVVVDWLPVTPRTILNRHKAAIDE